ncbi:MAG: hypothetical protein IIB65_11060, partial [Proteobacteria bacterium]|nr:hypothetical protein [Pseudomonadota bacterium]
MSDIRRKISGSGFIGSLIRDRRGAVAVYIAIITPVMIGIGALTLDLGRVITLHSELQYAADSASLAGARELDRFDGAIKRARAAAQGAVSNIQTFAADGGGKEVAIVVTTDCAFPPVPPCVRFLKTLPADDGDPILPSDVTTKDDEARFMEVHVGARAVTNALIQIVTLGSGPSTISTVASAVAGNDQVICRIPPMFMCNPTEPDGNLDLELEVDLAVLAGVQMEMFHQGGTGQYTPGNFGLLCPTGTEGSPCGAGFVRDALASTTGTCVSLNVAETKTGVTLQMVRTGINARHDFYTPQAKTSDNIAWRTLDEFVPAANVTQGGKPPNNTQGNQTKCEYNDIMADVVNAAGQTEAEWIDADPINNTADNFVATGVEETATGFPRDQCINADNCATDGAVAGNQRIGDGNWDYINYYRINHGCDPFANPTCKPADWDGVTGAAGWPPTRYETYRYEIERTPEAIVMPSLIPNLIVNGGTGIAVGMATNMAPHNLGETCDAIALYLDNPRLTLDELMAVLPAPDFPTAGLILGTKGVREAYETGRGAITMQAKIHIEPQDNGRNSIVITEVPYQVQKTRLIEQIAELVKQKKVTGISDIFDYSSKGEIRVVIEVRRDTDPQRLLNYLLKHTQLRVNFHILALALVDGKPQVLPMVEQIKHYVAHRRVVIRRRTRFRLNKAEQRLHILEGLIRALDIIDEIIILIRASETPAAARRGLMAEFEFSQTQAQHILEMQLQRLTSLERERLEKERDELVTTITDLKEILANPKRVIQIIKDDLAEIKKKHGNPRRTRIIKAEAHEIGEEDMIPEEEMIITITRNGY